MSTDERDMAAPAAAQAERAEPCVMVIFGASGDLTKRKLMPALYNLAKLDLLSRDFAVVGIARAQLTTEAFREKIRQDLQEFSTTPPDPAVWERLEQSLYYQSGEIGDAQTYAALKETLERISVEHGTRGHHLYYLAIAPQFFGDVVRRLSDVGLMNEQGEDWRRVVIEKPFGRDLESARHLNKELLTVVREHQIYRIDHYLGKETVQNILVFRFGNGIFEPIWNRRYIDHIQITAAESVGVEQRGSYYDASGAMRDMIPNHLFQLVTLTAMEPPNSFQANAVRDEQSKILHAIQSFTPEDVLTKTVRGQYGEGALHGKNVPAYRTEHQVPPDSTTETFVAIKLMIDNWRWADVPFYIRTGKRLAKRVTEIAIQFKRAPFVLFRDTPVERLSPNRLVLHIQPDEGITLRFGAKIPGPLVRLGPVNMDFAYADYFGATSSTGYERLLYDAMTGDATLFQRADMVEAGWNVIAPIQDVWKALPPRSFPNYRAGSWGPAQADELLTRDGRSWRDIPL